MLPGFIVTVTGLLIAGASLRKTLVTSLFFEAAAPSPIFCLATPMPNVLLLLGPEDLASCFSPEAVTSASFDLVIAACLEGIGLCLLDALILGLAVEEAEDSILLAAAG